MTKVGALTQWYWKTDLHNLLRFLKLRMDEHAQLEIRAYANEIANVVRRWVPLAYEAFEEYWLKSVLISERAKRVLERIIAGEPVEQEGSGLSVAEWRELVGMFRLDIASMVARRDSPGRRRAK